MIQWRESSFARWLILTAYFLTLFIPVISFAGTSPAGVPPGALWFSKEPIFAGETVSVFTLIYNSTDSALSGTIALRDGTTTLTKKEFVVAGRGAAEVIVFPWNVTPGNHSFSVVITQSELSGREVGTERIVISGSSTTPIRRFADYDTDGDGVGNTSDIDDDDDGLLDAEEKKLHTDPTNKDTDGDGIDDRQDEQPLVFNKKEKPVATTTQIITEHAEVLEKKIQTAIPEPILSKAVPVLGFIEDVRIAQAGRGAASLDAASERVVALRVASSSTKNDKTEKKGWDLFVEGVKGGEVFATPFAYVKLFATLIYYSITSSPYIFYPFILLVIYQVFRITFRFFL